MLADDPAFDTNNYHGLAERHWGLLHADGTPKPAFLPFLNGALSANGVATAQSRPAASTTAAGR